IKARPRAIDAPKRFHGEILGDAGVTNDANDPRVHFPLVLAKQCLEGFQVPGREPFQKFHPPLSTLYYRCLAREVTRREVTTSPHGLRPSAFGAVWISEE